MNIIIDEEIRLFGDTSRHLAATLFNECLQFLSVGELLQIPRHNKGQPCQRAFAGLYLLAAWKERYCKTSASSARCASCLK